jgi:uncharacterized OsmC-like protein
VNKPAIRTRFKLLFEGEGHNKGRYRTDVTVHRRAQIVESFHLPTDEGKIIGGDGTAPYPLAYFVSGLTGCLTTHLRSFSERLNIPLRHVSVNTSCHWEARQVGDAIYESAPIAFTIDVDMGDDLSEADQRRLLDAARKGCFVEQSLKPGIVRHRLKVANEWVDLD